MARKFKHRCGHGQTLKQLGTRVIQTRHENVSSSLFLAPEKDKLPYLKKVDIECPVSNRWGEIDVWYLALSANQYVADKYERRKKSKNRVIVKLPILHITLKQLGYMKFFNRLKCFFFRMSNAKKTDVSSNGFQIYVFPNCQSYAATRRVQKRLNIALDNVTLHLKTSIANYHKANPNHYLFAFFKALYLT